MLKLKIMKAHESGFVWNKSNDSAKSALNASDLQLVVESARSACLFERNEYLKRQFATKSFESAQDFVE